MSLDVWFKEDIKNALVALNGANASSLARFAPQANDADVQLYRAGYCDALRAVAVALGITLTLPEPTPTILSLAQRIAHRRDARGDEAMTFVAITTKQFEELTRENVELHEQLMAARAIWQA